MANKNLLLRSSAEVGKIADFDFHVQVQYGASSIPLGSADSVMILLEDAGYPTESAAVRLEVPCFHLPTLECGNASAVRGYPVLPRVASGGPYKIWQQKISKSW
jgi:hypothetical protein